MLEWLKKLLGIKTVKIIINNNDIKIKTRDPDDIGVYDVIETFNLYLRITSITSIYKNRYYPDNIYITYGNVKVRDDDYIWKLNGNHFSNKFLKYVWARAFESITRWENSANIKVKVTIVYPDGIKTTVHIKSKKYYKMGSRMYNGRFAAGGIVYDHKYHWE